MKEYGSTEYKGSINKGYADSWRKRLEEELEAQQEAEMLQASQQQKEEDERPWYEKVGSFLGDTGKNIASGVQQGAGKVADVAIKGGALLDELALVGQSGEKADKKRAQNLANTEKLREGIKSWSDIKGDKIEGTTDDIGINDLDDPRKVAELAGESLDVGLSATMFANPTSLLRQGAGKETLKAGAKTGLSIGAGRETAKMTAKEVAKMAGKDAALFGGLDGTSATLNALGEGDELDDALLQGGQTALLSGATQGSLDVGGAVAGKVIGDIRNKPVRENAKKIADAEAKSQADLDNAATEAAKEMELDAQNPLRNEPEEDLRKQLDEFMEGSGRTDDVEADYARVQAIKDELSARERSAYFENGGQTKAEATKALEDFDLGVNRPESVMTEAKPVVTLDDVIRREDLPQVVKEAALEIDADRQMINQQMEGLMSPQVKADEVARLDDQYDNQLKQITQKYSSLEQPRKGPDNQVDQTSAGQTLSGEYKTDIRFQVAKEKLDTEYKERIAELDMLEAQDFDEVQKFQGMLDTIETRGQNIVMDTRKLMTAAPDRFRDIDEAEAEAVRATLAENVKNAERFDDGKGIVTEAATSPDPVKSIENNPDGKASVRADIAESTSNLEGFKNASGVRQAALGLMSPSKNFEAFGLRELHDAIVVGDAKLQLANKADFEKLAPIAKAINGNKNLQKQIVDYLEGGRQTLSATDQKTADAIRSLLDEKKAWLQDNGFATMDDYFPHMFDVKGPEAKRIFNAKTTGDIKFGNIKQRLSESDDYSREIIDVLSAYTQGINKKIHLEPTLKPLDDLKVMDKVTDMEADWINKYIAQLKGTGDRSALEKGFNSIVDGFLGKTNSKATGGNHYRAVLGGQRMISAVATMGLNPGTALRNLTQVVNTVAGIGPKWSAVGMVQGARALRAGKNSPEYKEMMEAGVFSGGVSKNYNADLDEFSTKITGLKGKSNAVANKMMLMVSVTDSTMRAQAYWGAKASGLSKGMSEADAMKFAREKVIDTQFVTSKVDMPTNLNGPGMRSLTQLATFSAKQAEFMASLGVKLVKGKDGTYSMGRGEQAVSLLAAAGTAGVATAALEPLIGFNSEEFIPFYPQIAPFIPGANKEVSDALYRSPLVTLLAGDGKSKMGLVEAINQETQANS